MTGPFVDTRPDDPADWKLIEFPLYPDHHDARLRYGMVGVLREKLAGKPVVMTQFVPPWDDQDGIPVFATAQELRDWHADSGSRGAWRRRRSRSVSWSITSREAWAVVDSYYESK